MTIPVAVEIRFHHWNEILKMPQPDAAMKTATVFWHFARGLALAGTGKVTEAEAEYKIVSDAEAATPARRDLPDADQQQAKDILKIAKDVLGAKIALAKKDNAARSPCCAKPSRSRTHSNTASRPTGFFRCASRWGHAADEWRCRGGGESFPRRS